MECESDNDSSDSEVWSDEDDDGHVVLKEGVTFAAPTQALYAVQDHALKQGKSVKVTSHGGADRRIVCTSASCGFFVRLYRRSKIVDGKRRWLSWYISSLNLTHTNCVGVAKPTERQIAGLTIFSSALKGSVQPPVSSLIDQVREAHGISLSNMKRKVYRAMNRVREETDEEARRSYSRIAPYLAAFAEMNPGTIAVAEKDGISRFKRCVVVVGASVRAASACQRIVGIDCSHSKSKHFSGVQIHLVGRDGNFKNLTIAFGLVPAEDLDSYNWFLDKVGEAGFDLSDIPIFCDRHASIQSAAESRQLHLRFCTLHIIRNIAHNFGKLNQQDKNLVWSIQASETNEEYVSKLEVLKIALGEPVRAYVSSIEPSKWCVFANIKVKALYGWRTSNFVESVFGSQLVSGMRRLHPLPFMKRLCEKLMNDFYTRSTFAEEWAGASITPGAMAVYDKQAANIGSYTVMRSSRDESYVSNNASFPRLTRRVIFSAKDCSCAFLDQYGIPCRHLIAALADHDKQEDAPKYFHSYYTVAAYKDAFGSASIRIPLDQDLVADPSWLPPLVQKRRGRHKTKRIRSNGES